MWTTQDIQQLRQAFVKENSSKKAEQDIVQRVTARTILMATYKEIAEAKEKAEIAAKKDAEKNEQQKRALAIDKRQQALEKKQTSAE